MRAVGKASLLVMAVSTLFGTGGGQAAAASGLDDVAVDGPSATAQDGDQNFDCGNTHDLANVNALRSSRQKTCAQHPGGWPVGSGTSAAGGTAVGPQFTTAQHGVQNLDCGNSADVFTVNVLGSIEERTVCDTALGSAHFSGSRQGRAGGRGGPGAASAVGGTAVGPQFTTAQQGVQNLDCGNSADVFTVNVLGSIEERTVCDTALGSAHFSGSRQGRAGGRGGPGAASAVGGTAVGPQFTTAQQGVQNLDCGNSADMFTVNVLGTIEQRTTCTAVDRSGGSAPTRHHGFAGGWTTADGGTTPGPQSATAQNGRQNLHCGADQSLMSVPVLGDTGNSATCRAVHGFRR